MKCRAKVIYFAKKTKTGKKSIAFTLNPDSTSDELLRFIKYDKRPSRYELYARNGEMYECQGHIQCQISAINEPYMGGSSAGLSVIFKCDTCGHSHYPYLFNEYTINEWINNIISKME
jgi:hypothetical protein